MMLVMVVVLVVLHLADSLTQSLQLLFHVRHLLLLAPCLPVIPLLLHRDGVSWLHLVLVMKQNLK